MGSNPGDAKFDHRFSFGDWVDCKKETVTTTITRGDLNQPSSIWICGYLSEYLFLIKCQHFN